MKMSLVALVAWLSVGNAALVGRRGEVVHRGHAFVGEVAGYDFHRERGHAKKAVEVNGDMKAAVARLLKGGGTKPISYRELTELGIRQVNVKAAVQRHEGTLPANLASLVNTRALEANPTFAEESLAKAREYLNKQITEAWKNLDDELFECKAFEESNDATSAQVRNDMNRCNDTIGNLQSIVSESEDEIRSAQDEISNNTGLLGEEQERYLEEWARNSTDLEVRMNDMEVFARIVQTSTCDVDQALELFANGDQAGDDVDTTMLQHPFFEYPRIGELNYSTGPPDCGLFYDNISITYGEFKDKYDSLLSQMEAANISFEKRKAQFHKQLDVLEESIRISNSSLKDAQEGIAASQKEMEEKKQQLDVLVNNSETFMSSCTERIEWILYQDICPYLALRQSVLDFSTTINADEIADCDMSEWNWNADSCSVDCDDNCSPDSGNLSNCGGVQNVTRNITQQPSPNASLGYKCALTVKSKQCNQIKCPVDCGTSDWSDWTECSADCEGDFMARSRNISVAPTNGGQACPPLKETKPCTGCSGDCTLEEWSSWTRCSVACGGGFQERFKKVLEPAFGSNGTCPEENSSDVYEIRACNDDECQDDDVCTAEQNLILMIDGSGSIAAADFEVLKGFAGKLVGKYSANMHVGVVLFGNGKILPDGSLQAASTVQNLTDNFEAVTASIQSLEPQEGFTNMAQALTLAGNMLRADVRTNALATVLILTDGKPSFHFSTGEEAQKLKDFAEIFFVPVMDTWNPSGEVEKPLTEMATDPWTSYLVHVPGFKALAQNESFVHEVIKKSCPQAGIQN